MEIAAKPGDIIKHPLYGKGTVIKVESTFFTLNFPNRGIWISPKEQKI